MKRCWYMLLIVSLMIPFSIQAQSFLKTGAPKVQDSTTSKTSFPDFSSLVKALESTVVNIAVEIEEGSSKGDTALPDLPLYKKGPGRTYYSAGSGFIISPEGHIATCNHVIEKAEKVIIRIGDDDSEYPAEVLGTGPKTDLALLKIDPKEELVPVFVGDSDELDVGQWVLAIGNQFQLGQTVTAGIVSAKSRRVPARSSGPYDAFIQTDASINPGSSGGPLFNSKGQVVGISTAIYSPGQSQFGGAGFNIGIGFAIPINFAKSILEQLKDQGKVTRGLLGVIIQKIDPQVAKVLKLESSRGALVADVLPDSPAEKAGAKIGDVVLKFNGREVKDHDDLPLMVATTDIGTVAALDIIRDGVKMQLHPKIVVLNEDKQVDQDGTSEESQSANELGLYLEDLNKELSTTLKLPVSEGVLVKGIEPGSLADQAGVVVGDIILELNREKITTGEDISEQIEGLDTGDSVLLLVRRQTGTRFLTFEMKK
ncbi:MAG: trypsin-like peptidase domain-containing protein [Bdellovibrionota bacterium]